MRGHKGAILAVKETNNRTLELKYALIKLWVGDRKYDEPPSRALKPRRKEPTIFHDRLADVRSTPKMDDFLLYQWMCPSDVDANIQLFPDLADTSFGEETSDTGLALTDNSQIELNSVGLAPAPTSYRFSMRADRLGAEAGGFGSQNEGSSVDTRRQQYQSIGTSSTGGAGSVFVVPSARSSGGQSYIPGGSLNTYAPPSNPFLENQTLRDSCRPSSSHKPAQDQIDNDPGPTTSLSGQSDDTDICETRYLHSNGTGDESDLAQRFAACANEWLKCRDHGDKKTILEAWDNDHETVRQVGYRSWAPAKGSEKPKVHYRPRVCSACQLLFISIPSAGQSKGTAITGAQARRCVTCYRSLRSTQCERRRRQRDTFQRRPPTLGQ